MGSLRNSPDPDEVAVTSERRRCVRQKLHTPVYATFNGPQTDMVVDLSELIDLHEDGFAVQTSQPLQPNQAVTLCLDLTETKSYVHGSGQVVWSDEAGRGGIRFAALPETSQQALKEWLFANLLIGCSNHAARSEQLAQRDSEVLSEPVPVPVHASVIPISERGDFSSSLDSIRREVRELNDDCDAVLQLVVERALFLTGATGTALAFLTDGKMICRARAGAPAPPLRAPVDVTQGLTGDCVRSGLTVSCEDAENDPRIDPEIGRVLGIGSLLAVPILSDFRVVGLIEVFSPHPRQFTKDHGALLDRLVELIPRNHREDHRAKVQPENFQAEAPAVDAAAFSEKPQPPASNVEATESAFSAREEALEPVPEPAASMSQFQWALLGLTILAVFFALGYLVGPLISKRLNNSAQSSQPSAVEAASKAPGQTAGQTTNPGAAQPKTLAELSNLADAGDAEAQYQMGVRCHNGEGVPHDDAQAMQWFLRAGEQGHVDAQAHLGAYYWAGRGVAKDLTKAYRWSAIALAQGDENSKSRMEGLAAVMTQSQISAAQQQAEAWIHQHTSSPKAAAN